MKNTNIEENTEDVVIEDISEETLLSLDENLEQDQETTDIAEGKCKKEEEEDMEEEEMTEGTAYLAKLKKLNPGWDPKDSKGDFRNKYDPDDEEDAKDHADYLKSADKFLDDISSFKPGVKIGDWVEIYIKNSPVKSKIGIGKIIAETTMKGHDYGYMGYKGPSNIPAWQVKAFVEDVNGDYESKEPNDYVMFNGKTYMNIGSGMFYIQHEENQKDRFRKLSQQNLKVETINEQSEMSESKKVQEAEVSSDKEFTEYAKSVLKAAHGDKYDEDKAMKTAEGILKKADGDYGAAIGMLTSGLGEGMKELDENKLADIVQKYGFEKAKSGTYKGNYVHPKTKDYITPLKADGSYFGLSREDGKTLASFVPIALLPKEMEKYDYKMKEDMTEATQSEITVDSSDITRLVESEEGLTEEFKEKASIIFEAAVKSKVKETEEALKESYAVTLIEEVENIKEEMVDKIDNYLTYAVECWVEDNAVAIESTLRTEIAENFIQSLKTVFTENYIEVPEGKVDLYAKLEEQKQETEEKLSQSIDIISGLVESVETLSREKIISEFTADLADTQAEKLKSLVEDIEYSSESKFRTKVETIKEFYVNGPLFDSETKSLNEDKNSYVTTETIVEDESEVHVSPSMKNYLTAISRLNNATTANL